MSKDDFVADVPLARNSVTPAVADCAAVSPDDTGTKRSTAVPTVPAAEPPASSNPSPHVGAEVETQERTPANETGSTTKVAHAEGSCSAAPRDASSPSPLVAGLVALGSAVVRRRRRR